MRVYVAPPKNMSRAMQRVATALGNLTPPGVAVVSRQEIADLVVLHVIDHNGVPEVIEDLKSRGQHYSIIQYCLRSTTKPNTIDWLDIWSDAASVWSYYDLEAMLVEDGHNNLDEPDLNFFIAPLGCDAHVFNMNRQPIKYLAATSGYVAESECVDAVAAATARVGHQQFHLGPDLHLGAHVTSKLGISDTELARCYNASQFVTGLRRCEGFELPMVEGLFCGCRPITFDKPHYTKWFGEVAELIPEGSAEDVTEHVVEIFERGVRPVTAHEQQWARNCFNWSSIVPMFWKVTL